MTRFRQRIRQKVLKERGLEAKPYGQLEKVKPVTIRVKLAGTRKFPPVILPTRSNKSIVIRLIEERIGQPIEDVLWLGSVNEVAGALGVHYSTVSKWRKQLMNGSIGGTTGAR